MKIPSKLWRLTKYTYIGLSIILFYCILSGGGYKFAIYFILSAYIILDCDMEAETARMREEQA